MKQYVVACYEQAMHVWSTLAHSVNVAMGASTRIKHSITATYNKMEAFSRIVKQWLKIIGFWTGVLGVCIILFHAY